MFAPRYQRSIRVSIESEFRIQAARGIKPRSVFKNTRIVLRRPTVVAVRATTRTPSRYWWEIWAARSDLEGCWWPPRSQPTSSSSTSPTTCHRWRSISTGSPWWPSTTTALGSARPVTLRRSTVAPTTAARSWTPISRWDTGSRRVSRPRSSWWVYRLTGRASHCRRATRPSRVSTPPSPDPASPASSRDPPVFWPTTR